MKCVFLVLCLWLISGPALAGALPGWVKDVIKSTSIDAPQGAPAEILYDYTRIELDDALRAKIKQRWVARILNSDDELASSFHVMISKGGRLDDFQAWTLQDGKHYRTTEERDVIESTYMPGVYSDLKRYILRAPTTKIGDYVAFECEYEEQLRFPSRRWTPQMRGWPVARSVMEIGLPEGWEMMVHPTGVSVQEITGKKGYRKLEVRGLEMIPKEPDRPKISRIAPRVLLRFLDPEGTQSYEDWGDVASWYQSICAPKILEISELGELTSMSLSQSAADALKIFSEEVQHSISYVAIELGEQSWVPDAAGDTWRRRYGDCKDKATVLVAALAAKGIEAHPVLVCTSDRWSVIPEAPNPAQFNHCIVAFEWDGDPAYSRVVAKGPSGKNWAFFDPTASHVPLGYLPRTVSGTWAVIADSSEGLVKLPAMSSLTLRQEANLDLGPDGNVEGNVIIMGEGIGGGVIAYLNEQHPGRPEQWLAHVLGKSWTGVELSAPLWLGADSTGFTASVQFTVRSHDMARPWSSSWMFQPLFSGSRDEPPPPDSLRTLPIWLDGPFAFEDRIVISLPPDCTIDPPPEHRWRGDLGEYMLSCREEAGQLILDRRYEIREEEVPARRYPELRELWQTAYEGDTSAILIMSKP